MQLYINPCDPPPLHITHIIQNSLTNFSTPLSALWASISCIISKYASYRDSKSTFYNGVPVKCVRDSILCPAWFITCSLVPFLVWNFSGGGGGGKVFLRYPDISEIWLRFFLNMPQICLRYSRDMNHIWLRYSLNECLRYAWDLPRISLK